MAITKAQIIDTVLMRYGNRQGNTALQAQALIEWDLVFEDFYDMPKLPKFLTGRQLQLRIAQADGVHTLFTQVAAGREMFDVSGMSYDRFTEHDADNPTVVVLGEGPYGAEVATFRPLLPMSVEELLEKHTEAGTSNIEGPLTHYIIRPNYVLDSETSSFKGDWVMEFYPTYGPEVTLVRICGYVRAPDLWRLHVPNLVIAALGMRMGRYVKDADEIAAFTQEYMREFRKLFDAEVASEEAYKYGNRGVN